MATHRHSRRSDSAEKKLWSRQRRSGPSSSTRSGGGASCMGRQQRRRQGWQTRGQEAVRVELAEEEHACRSTDAASECRGEQCNGE